MQLEISQCQAVLPSCGHPAQTAVVYNHDAGNHMAVSASWGKTAWQQGKLHQAKLHLALPHAICMMQVMPSCTHSHMIHKGYVF